MGENLSARRKRTSVRVWYHHHVKISLFFFQRITNATKDLLKIIVESKSAGFVPKAVQTVEDKYIEYAEENLEKRHNGTLQEETDELGKSCIYKLYKYKYIHTYFIFKTLINNSWAKHKGNHNRSSGFISDKTHVGYHKTFDSIFSAYTTSILKFFLANKQTRSV